MYSIRQMKIQCNNVIVHTPYCKKKYIKPHFRFDFNLATGMSIATQNILDNMFETVNSRFKPP